MYTAWKFRTARFTVRLMIEEVSGYQYDGDDEGGETQAALDSGELVAFDSRVIVELDGREVGSDSLCGSVYKADSVAEFYTAHRDPDPMNRNCSEMRAAKGGNVAIGHYFPDMVSNAIAEAREFLGSLPPLRGDEDEAEEFTPEEKAASDNLAAILAIVGPYDFGIEGGGAAPLFLARHTKAGSMVAIGTDGANLSTSDPAAPIWYIQATTDQGDCFDAIHNAHPHPLPLAEVAPLASDIADALPAEVMDRCELVGRIAGLFADLLRKHLGEETMEEIRQRNVTYDGSVCASHDFCDANMVMQEAVEAMGLETFPEYRVTWNWEERFPERGGISEAVTDLWNEAWAVAKDAFLTAEVDGARAEAEAAGFTDDFQMMTLYRPNGWHIGASDVDGSGDPLRTSFALVVYGPDDDCEEDSRFNVRSGEGLTFTEGLALCLTFMDCDEIERAECFLKQFHAWCRVTGIPFDETTTADEVAARPSTSERHKAWLADFCERHQRNEEGEAA